MTRATQALESHDLSGEGINFGSHKYFFTTQNMEASPNKWLTQSGATSETTRTLKTIHTMHSLIHYKKADIIRMIMMAKWYSENHGSLKLPDICLTGEENPRKNLSQETCPDRGSQPGPLRDRRACYRLLHSGELSCNMTCYYFNALYLNSTPVWNFKRKCLYGIYRPISSTIIMYGKFRKYGHQKM